MSKQYPPETWASSNLGAVVEKIQYGATASAKSNGKLKLLRITDITNSGVNWDSVPYCDLSLDEGEKYILKHGDILIARTGGTVGKSFRVTDPPPNVIFASYLIRLSLKEPFRHESFIRDFLRSPNYWRAIQAGAKGAAQPNVNTETLKAINLPVPPVGEQKRIVAKIESTHEKIKVIEDSVTKAEELIEKYREALLQKAFRGELVKQDPNDEPASKLLERIRAERVQASDSKKKNKDDLPPIKPEEIPFEIPKSWEWVRLGEIVDFQGGSQPPKAEFRYKPGPGLIRLVQIRDFKNDDHIVFIPEKINKRHFSKDDIMIGRYGPPIFQILRGLEGSYNVALMKAVPSACIDREYLYWYLQEPRIQRDVNRKSERAAGQTGVNLSFLNQYLVPLPPIDTQVNIAKFIVEALSLISKTESRIKLLKEKTEEMTNAILGAAFSGSLVPQDVDEGTGHELLEKIRSEHPAAAKTNAGKKTLVAARKKRAKK